MKINRISFEESQTSKVGLKEIKLERLGNVVALIGKNGSGKTRILNFIEANFSSIFNINTFLKGNITDPPNSIQHYFSKLQPYKQIILKKDRHNEIFSLSKEDPNNEKLKMELSKIKTEISKLESLIPQQRITLPQSALQQLAKDTPQDRLNAITKELNPLITRLQQDYIKRVDYSQIRQLQDAISEKDDDASSFESLIENVTDQLDYNEFGSIYKSSLKFLKKLPHQLVDDWMDCLGDKTKFEKRTAYLRFIALKEIFDNIFGKTLEWKQKKISKKVTEQGVESITIGVWEINNREFNYAEFSDGEKTLFAYVLLFFLMSQNKGIRLKESIIIIDEPELHLHPDSEIDLINGIRNIIEEKGQLWIATHSINILSHLNFDEVFMVKDGQIKYPSRTIQLETLSELMKIEDRVEKLSEFLMSISEWTFVHFMIECFTNPEVIEIAKESDPQVTSLKEFINLNAENANSLLLDFGAGKGRLFEQAMIDEKFKKIVEYSALEPNKEHHHILTTKGVKRIYSSYEELIENTFDFIVLCNVLHEIELEEWVPTLNKIITTLKPSGKLIIIEAKNLTKGEQVGSIGYLLLDQYEIQVLFALNQLPITLNHKEPLENITCVLIPKTELSPISIESLINTMKALEKNTFEKIEKLRQNKDNNSSNTKLGRQSAFLSQLHINSKLAQKFLVKNKK